MTDPLTCRHVPAVAASGEVRCERCGVRYAPLPVLEDDARCRRAVIDAALRDYATGACTADEFHRRLQEVQK